MTHSERLAWMFLIGFGTSSVTLAVIVVLMIRHIERSQIVTPTIILTTVGYGDVMVVSHLTRSVTILIGLSGKLYMTILIAMLVGKVLAASQLPPPEYRRGSFPFSESQPKLIPFTV